MRWVEINSRESGSVPNLLPTPRSSLSSVTRTGSRVKKCHNVRDTCRGSEPSGPVLPLDSQWTGCSAAELSSALILDGTCWSLCWLSGCCRAPTLSLRVLLFQSWTAGEKPDSRDRLSAFRVACSDKPTVNYPPTLHLPLASQTFNLSSYYCHIITVQDAACQQKVR